MQIQREMEDESSNANAITGEAVAVAMTYDEASMERSRNFLTALQELKNMRQQLYSAAEYCESSYIYSEQKHAVLDNLKDYTIKALVNAVDHMGTVAYKLNELSSQQMEEVSSADVRVTCLAQRIRLCKEHTDYEGLRQQQLIKDFPRFHKHYISPAVSGDIQEESISSRRAQSGQMMPGGNWSRHQAAELNPFTNGEISSRAHHSVRTESSRAGSDELSFSEKEMPHSVVTRAATSVPARPSILHSTSSTPYAGSPASSVDSSKSFSTVFSNDARRNNGTNRTQSRSKSRIFSILGRRRSSKSKDPISP